MISAVFAAAPFGSLLKKGWLGMKATGIEKAGRWQ
jgi:hypothetical protein